MRNWRERDRARHGAQTDSERQATLQWKGACEHERIAAETPEERETRLQRMSTKQRERLAVKLLTCLSATTGSQQQTLNTIDKTVV